MEMVNNIDNKIRLFLEKLEELKDTHPNIHALWSKYINDKTESLIGIIDKGMIMLESAKHIQDLTNEQIIITYCIKNHYNT